MMIRVRAEWDDEAEWWTATSEDVPGLVTGAASLQDLKAKLPDMIAELFELNGRPNLEGEDKDEIVIVPEGQAHARLCA
jgi:hypothetical protein